MDAAGGPGGAAYGAYRHGGLAAAVLAHLALNTAHFGLYTLSHARGILGRAAAGADAPMRAARPALRPQASAG